MKALILIVLLAGFILAEPTIVELLVFSGRENPRWTLSNEQNAVFLSNVQLYGVVKQSSEVLGYQGFHVTWTDESGRRLHGFVLHETEFELFLLSTLMENAPELVIKPVVEHVTESINIASNQHVERTKGEPVYECISKQANIYDVGPDNVTAFDPSKWNKNSQVQYNNNCYNYANDIRTDTFAQPGRGTGRKWEANTCPNVTAASVRDGLIVLDHQPLTEEQPKVGHYIALVMWEGVNFHWYKKDISTYWSHKPGSTPARDTDNSGKKIPDPKYADRGPYTVFCGYFTGIPSQVTIN